MWNAGFCVKHGLNVKMWSLNLFLYSYNQRLSLYAENWGEKNCNVLHFFLCTMFFEYHIGLKWSERRNLFKVDMIVSYYELYSSMSMNIDRQMCAISWYLVANYKYKSLITWHSWYYALNMRKKEPMKSSRFCKVHICLMSLWMPG
jgi:hypothetical protein